MNKEDQKKSQNSEILLFKKYKLLKNIGSGFFGTVFSGLNVLTKEKVAIKIEKSKKTKSILEREAYILFYLKGPGLPEVKSFGKTKRYNILVETLLGRSLHEIYIDCNKKFSIKDICMIGFQLLERLEYIHSKNYIHRDIKPHNLLVDFRNEGHLYIVDFGLAKKYKSDRGNHVKFSINKMISGTPRYCSANSMRGVEQSRRDDLESLCYLIIYFFKGSLPWQGINISSKDKRFKIIYKMKKTIKIETLCEGLPHEIIDILKYTKNLGFSETPKYDYIKNLFVTILKKNGYEYDNKFSWIKEGTNNSKVNTIKHNHKRTSPFNRLYHKIQNSLENKKRKRKENNDYTLNTIYNENLDNSLNITDISNIKKKNSIKSDDNNIFHNNLLQLNIDNHKHSYNYPLVVYNNKLYKNERDDSNFKKSNMDIPDKISMIETTPSNLINVGINDGQMTLPSENIILRKNKNTNSSKIMKLHNFIRQEEKEGGVIGKTYDFTENEFFKNSSPIYLTNEKNDNNYDTLKHINKRISKTRKYLNITYKNISNKAIDKLNNNSKLINSNITLNYKIPKENISSENMFTITSSLDENKKSAKIEKTNNIKGSYNPKFNNIFLLQKMKLSNNENIYNNPNDSPKSESKKGIIFKFKEDVCPQKLFHNQIINNIYNFNKGISMNFINKTIHINNKKSINQNNNKIKNVNKTRHYIKINNNKKDIILKRNNTIEYGNDHEYESIFNYRRNKSSNSRNKIIQSNNNYNIKDRNKHNHIFHPKYIGKKNKAINLIIPPKNGNDIRFTLFNSFNQNNKSYNFLNNSKTKNLSKNSNSFNSDFIKDSFNSINNNLNKNKGKSIDGIMKNNLIAKNNFNNLYNNNKIISDFNGPHNSLNEDEKLNNKNYLYHTPFLVRKVLQKKK